MSYRVIPTEVFLRDVKRLKKRYPKILEDMDQLIEHLETHPDAGTSLGQHLFKIRVKSSDKQSGKRSGFRVIYYFAYQGNIYLLKAYSKNISNNFIRQEFEKIVASLGLDE